MKPSPIREMLTRMLRARALGRNRAAVRTILQAESAWPAFVHQSFSLLEEMAPVEKCPVAWLLLGGQEEAVDACLHQTLVNHLRNHASPALLRAKESPGGYNVAPMSARWRRLLASRGVQLSPLGCTMSLWRLAWREWAAGVHMLTRLAGPARRLASAPGRPYAVLAYSQHGRYFAPAEARRQERGVDYLSWYQQWKDRVRDVGHVWIHAPGGKDLGADCQFVDWPLPYLPWSISKVAFSIRAVLAAIFTLMGMVAGRWGAGMMLREAILWHYARALPATALAREYLFDSAHCMVRPLWTYAAEKAGARIVMVAYGVNDLYFDPTTGPNVEDVAGAGVMTWPLWVVMSEDQARIRQAVHKHPFRWLLVDRIDRIDDGLPVPQRHTLPRVAVFDIVPIRTVTRAVAGMLPMYFRWDVCVSFLKDITQACEALGLETVLKSKKDRRSTEDKRYTCLKETLAANGHLVTLSPWTAAARVIDACEIVISLPFSSTGVIAARMGKPSVFYDPTGLLAARCPRLHGIAVVSGRESLEAWLRQAAHEVTPR